VVAVIAAVLVVTSSGGGSPAPGSTATSRTSATRSTKRARHRAAVAAAPSSVTVAVLNGTGTSHLAADIMGKLTSAGYKPGTTTNAPNQTMTSTVVGYTQPGYRADALEVAKSLNLGSASVQGVAAGDRAAACHTTAACPAQIVVTVGSDLASNASSSASTG
jgi:hypothetical protein